MIATCLYLKEAQARSLAEQIDFIPATENGLYFVLSLRQEAVYCRSYEDYSVAKSQMFTPSESPLGSFILRVPNEEENINMKARLDLEGEGRGELAALIAFVPERQGQRTGDVFALVFFIDNERIVCYEDGRWS